MKKTILLLIALIPFLSCNKKSNTPTVAFLDAFEDETIAQAKKGFFDALDKNGFSETNNTIKVIYRNAQNDIPTLTQAVDYFISEDVDLIASNTTLSTITTVQKTKSIPVFMLVAPSPELAGLTDKEGKAPGNLYGVYETLDYIDTSVTLIKTSLPQVKIVGAIYNQSEPQSQMALNKIKDRCEKQGITLKALPANNSSETQLVVDALINQKIDAFFALPDNTVFASFETINNSCKKASLPVFTSEAGLVKRGALTAFGADMYMWGYQAGEQAASFLKSNSTKNLHPEIVRVRRRVYNPQVANFFKITFDKSFIPVQ